MLIELPKITYQQLIFIWECTPEDEESFKEFMSKIIKSKFDNEIVDNSDLNNLFNENSALNFNYWNDPLTENRINVIFKI